MKYIITILLLGSIASFSNAQTTTSSVEKSMFGIQAGIVGLWAYNEARLTNQVVFRSELGFDHGLWGGGLFFRENYPPTPVITLEPRWYYNLNKRAGKSKVTEGNSANFLSLRTSYRSDVFEVGDDAHSGSSDVIIVPTWGIRRSIGKHFDIETGIGAGYRYVISNGEFEPSNRNEGVLQLRLRIGYCLTNRVIQASILSNLATYS